MSDTTYSYIIMHIQIFMYRVLDWIQPGGGSNIFLKNVPEVLKCMLLNSYEVPEHSPKLNQKLFVEKYEYLSLNKFKTLIICFCIIL